MILIDSRSAWEAFPPSVRTPVLSSAPEFAVPAVDWWIMEWVPFWREWRNRLEWSYLPGSGMCDEFAAVATGLAVQSGRKTLGNRDCRIAAWQCRMRILPGGRLHGIGDGAHAAMLIGYHHPDEIEPQWAIYEPQGDNWRGNVTDLHALPPEIILTDIWF